MDLPPASASRLGVKWQRTQGMLVLLKPHSARPMMLQLSTDPDSSQLVQELSQWRQASRPTGTTGDLQALCAQ